MRQRIATASKSMAAVAAAAATVSWIDARSTAATTTPAGDFSLPEASRSQRNTNGDGSDGSSTRGQQQQQPFNLNSAFTAFSVSSVHRSSCDASAAPSPPSSWSFLPSFLGTKKASSTTTTNNTATAIDETYFEKVKTPDRSSAKQHAIFGTLAGETMIESYEMYRPKKAAFLAEDSGNKNNDRSLVLVGIVDFGTHLNGYGGIVHGGILSLMFDEIMGWACYEVMDSSSTPVTANLNVNFRKPVVEGSRVKIKVYLDKQEGRKYFWKAEMLGSKDGGKDDPNGEEILYAEATSLYIVLRDKK